MYVKLPDLWEEFEHVFVSVEKQLLFLWFSISAGNGVVCKKF